MSGLTTDLAIKVKELFDANEWTLGLAESCTGGNISAAIVAIPGSSSFHQGSIVSYSNDVKQGVLGVSRKTLEEFGAVSEQTTEQMARGAREQLKSTWALSVSGIAGPDGGRPDKPVGTVCFTVSGTVFGEKGNEASARNIEFSETMHFEGSRQDVIAASTRHALTKLSTLNEVLAKQ